MFLLIDHDGSGKGIHLVISIHLMFLLIRTRSAENAWHCNFNTSHVSINLFICYLEIGGILNFNTSHVSINRRTAKGTLDRRKNFNTSHVSINQ